MSPSLDATYTTPPSADNPAEDPNARLALVVSPESQGEGQCGWTLPSTPVLPSFSTRHFDTWCADRNSLGHGSAFAQLFGHICRYSHSLGAWFVFDGRSWVRDDGRIMEQLRLKACLRFQLDAKRLYEAALRMPGGTEVEQSGRAAKLEDARRFQKHVTEKLATSKALAVMVSSASTSMASDGSILSLAAEPSDFDTHPHLLNTQNCVIDLRTGFPQPHDQTLMLSKLAHAVYDPRARPRRFLKVVKQIMSDDMQRVRFLQRVLGYLLTAEARERKVIVFYGKSGNNGKSTVANVLARLLGPDYASGLPVATLLAKRYGSDEIDVGLTSINGKRVVLALEPNKGAHFNTGMIKALSGNDEVGVQARRPHQRELEDVRPGAKILLVTNHLPVWEDDQAFSSRFLVVPFNEHFSGAREQFDLSAQLVEQEGSGILAWLVEGARLYYKHGLNVPADLRAEQEVYRLEGDLVGCWFRDCCEPKPDTVSSVMDLHASYDWHLRHVLRAPGTEVLSLKAFSQELDRWATKRSRKRLPGSTHAATLVHGIHLRVGAGGEVLETSVTEP